MADDTTTPDAPDATGPVAEQPQQRDTDQQLGDAGKAALDAERKARRDAEKQLKAVNAELQGFRDANKSETEKLTDRATQAEQAATEATGKLRDLLAKQAIYDAASAAGTIDAETVYALLRDEVEVADDGTITGADKAVKALQAAKPHLFREAHQGHRDAANITPPPALNSDGLINALKAAVGAQ